LRIYPNKEQKEMFKQYALCHKYVYNKVITYLKNKKSTSKISAQDLRNKFVTSETRKYSLLWNNCNANKTRLFKKIKLLENKNSKWNVLKLYLMKKKLNNIILQYKLLKKIIEPRDNNLKYFEKEVHKDTRTIANNEAHTAWQTNIDLILKGKKDHFDLHFKTKKVFKKSYNFGLAPSMFNIKDNNIILTNKKLNINMLKLSCKSKKSLYKINCIKQGNIIYKKKKYYLCLCVCLKNTNINTKQINNVIGLDPGVSTFLSGFSNKELIKFQQDNFLNILNIKIDYLKSKNIKNKRKSLLKLERKKENIVNELHWKVINYLCKNYDIICIEKFSSKSCVESKTSNRFTNRRLNDLKHFKFRQRLIFKANNQGIEVIQVNPYYTSKFCSKCGNVKQKLSLSERVYNCENCKLQICRDLNACKNILMLGISSKK